MLTRRTIMRTYLFRPDEDGVMQNIYWYCLIEAAKKHGVLVHTAMLMSTHEHPVVTDVRGVMPDFVHDFHELLAGATKAHRGWSDPVFDKEKPSYVALLTAEAQIDKCGYGIANPVTGGVVKYARDWPGVTVHPSEMGRKTIRAERPAVYFNPDKWPPIVEMRLTLPPAVLEQYGEEGGRRAIAEAVERYERAAHARAKSEGFTFGTAKKAMRVPHTERAMTQEAVNRLSPTFAIGRDHAARRMAGATVRAFREAYRAALAKWRHGIRDILFPAGTWWMRVFHGAQCTPQPEPWLMP